MASFYQWTGDRRCDFAIDSVRPIITETDMPTFNFAWGISLGWRAGRYGKMKFGHHGANHPVQDIDRDVVMITSQNHGFAVDEDSLPDNVRVTHRSLFDGSNQGIELTDKPGLVFKDTPKPAPVR